jgi:dihydroorotate dehydrogenase
MRYPWISLKPDVANLPSLSEPLWIASSHHTQNEAAIRGWKEIKPAALTLKTSKKSVVPEEKDSIRKVLYPAVTRYGKSYYCDGPKQEELLKYDTTAALLKSGKETLPHTLIGVSTISGPDEAYDELRDLTQAADFYELNLKYSFRVPKAGSGVEFLAGAAEHFQAVLAEVDTFCAVFSDRPVFIKIPRELQWLPGTPEAGSLLDLLVKHGRAGLILTNSLKMNIVPFIHEGREQKLSGGVLCGEALFDGTIQAITELRQECDRRNIPIIASGGMIDEQHLLHAFRAGAAAAQLCTTFDYNRRGFYETLRSALTARIYMQGLKNFREFHQRLPDLGIAAIQQEPISYFDRFWGPEMQNNIRDDILRSEVMDVIVMSGATLFEQWKEVLRQRFAKNLGLRLLIPNVTTETYAAVQRSWGVTQETQIEARRSRVTEAKAKYETLWKETQQERRKAIGERESEATLEILPHVQVPFYSCYIFDDNAYVSPYPFVRASGDVPVYVFFRSSKEYDRLVNEFAQLREVARQMQPSAAGARPLVAQ